MKKIMLLLLLCIAAHTINAQDTVRIKHTYYTSVFVQSIHIPMLVSYTLSADMVSCANHLPRQSSFTADPKLSNTNLHKDYTESGYDCGHNMSAEDNSCNATGEKECFYYTNMFPQTGHLNRGVWKQLETLERQYAAKYGKLDVFIGSKGIAGYIGPDHVAVPAYCWKLIRFPDNTFRAYIFPNDNSTVSGPDNYLAKGKDLAEIKTTIFHLSKIKL